MKVLRTCPPFTSIWMQEATGIVVALGTDGRVYVTASAGGWLRLPDQFLEAAGPSAPRSNETDLGKH